MAKHKFKLNAPVQYKDELEIVEKIRTGDEYAYRDLFKTYYKTLVKNARRFVQDTQIAEDIVEDVFLNIWNKRAQLNITVSVKAYLFQMVRNHSLNYLKGKKLAPADEFYLNISLKSNISADEEVNVNEIKEHIQKAIAELPDRSRSVFTMHRYDNLKYSEIAEALKITEGTVETHMVRALKFLRKKLSFLLSVFTILNRM